MIFLAFDKFDLSWTDTVNCSQTFQWILPSKVGTSSLGSLTAVISVAVEPDSGATVIS